MRFGFYLFAIAGLSSAGSLPNESAPARHAGVTVPTKVISVARADPRSGQVVRTVSIKPQVAVPAPTGVSELKDLIASTAKQYEVSPELVDSVVQVESNYNSRAISPKGAEGVMQLMPQTAQRFGVRNTFDAKQNIEGGVRYLKFLTETFKDERLAIAAYNAGEGAVQKYRNIPPYPETIQYVANVGKKYDKARRAAASKRPDGVSADEKPKVPEYHKLAYYVDSEGRVFLITQ